MVAIGYEVEKFILVFFRILSMLWVLPLFDSRSISVGYKAGLSLIIAFLLYSSISPPDIQGDAYLLLLAIGKEVFVGLSIGFVVRLLFAMAVAAGGVVSMQSGLSFARAMDPTLGASATVIEQFQSLLTTMIFLGIDGHHAVLKGLAVSLREVPPGSVTVRPALFQHMVSSTGGIFAASLKICAPVIVTLFLVDLALGILARLIPQVNVFIEGASIKILLALTVLAVSLNLMVPVIGGVLRSMDGEILKILKCVV